MKNAIQINLDVFNLNKKLLNRSVFKWWNYNFSDLDYCKSATPDANIGFSTDHPSGLYLHFTLPRELRTAVDGKFPLSPNRWLILRVCDNGAPPKAVIMESDCPNTDNTGSLFLLQPNVEQIWGASKDPIRKGYATNRYNKSVVTNLGKVFDCADWSERAPNDVFLTTSENGDPMFSAYYPHCKNIFAYFDDMSGIEQANASYYIVGWLSSDTDSPLYFASSVNIPWRLNGEPEPNDPFTGVYEYAKINVAVGTNINEAFLAILEQTLVNAKEQNTQQILSAVSAVLNDYVNELPKPNAASVAYDNRRKLDYSSTDFALRFISEDDTKVGEVNKICEYIEALQKEVISAREDLWVKLWKYYFLNHLDFDNSTGADPETVNPENSADAIRKLAENLSVLNAKLKELSGKVTPQMKPNMSKRSYRPANPVILVSGVDAPADLASAFNGHNTLDLSGIPQGIPQEPAINAKNLPDGIARLISLMQTDRNYAVIHRQPYEPLCLEWQAKYINIPFGNWKFDGNTYHLQTGVELDTFDKEENRIPANGISPLSAHIKDLIVDKLQKFAKAQGETVNTDDFLKMKFLSQEMNGFTGFIAQRDVRPFSTPTNETIKIGSVEIPYAALLGFDNDDDFMQPDFFPALHNDNPNGTPYFELRSGAFTLTDLSIYDKFGRKLDIICHQESTGTAFGPNFPLIVSEMLRGFQHYALLSPAFLNKTSVNTDLNVVGYVVHNIINESLLLHDSNGDYCGEVTVSNDKPIFLPSDKPLGGKLNDFKDSISERSQFDKITVQISAALASVNVTDNDLISALLGRPLALIDTNFSFDFLGKPYKNINWTAKDEKSPDYQPPGYFDYNYNFALGSPNEREDGLIGYFTPDFKTFNASGTISPVPLKINSAAELILLCIPNYYFTLKTGLLPVHKINVDCANVSINARIDVTSALAFSDDESTYISAPKSETGKTFISNGKTTEISDHIKNTFIPSVFDGVIIKKEETKT